MTNIQPALLPELENLDLKSPVFRAGPGWGEKLNNWMKKNYARSFFAILIISVLATTLYLKIVNKTPAQSGGTNHYPNNNLQMKLTALPGQGITHLARRVLSEYITRNSTNLTPEQKIYAEDYLKKLKGARLLEIGQAVEFSESELLSAIKKARALKPWQVANLSKYTSRVKGI